MLRMASSSMRCFATSKETTSQFTNRAIMVEPTHFFLNEETFKDNKFMNKVEEDPLLSMKHTSSKKAKEEYKNFVNELRKHDL